MQKLLVVITIVFLFSCQNQSIKQQHINDSLPPGMTEEKFKQKFMDSAKKAMNESINADIIQKYERIGQNSPVTITGKVIKQDYGARQIELTLKNNSDKTVDGVKMGYSLYNNFGDNLSESYGFDWAQSQETIRPKSSRTVVVTTYIAATKVKHLFINEVHFTNDSSWIGGD